MSSANLEPSLESLFDQYEDIGGPETFGPNGTAILLSIWRKAKKLGWLQTFQMTNTELHFQTGIKSRDTINEHRNKLADAGIIQYICPPRGKSRGEYTLKFGMENKDKEVQNTDYFSYNEDKAVRNMDNLTSNMQKVVQETDNFTDTVLDLKDTITTTVDPFKMLIREYCALHSKLDIHIKTTDIVLMQWMITQQSPIDLILKVMRDLHKERTAAGTTISTFVYYKQAILDAWEAFKAITDRVPLPAVALGEESKTDGVPLPAVAPGSTTKRTKQQQELDDLRRRAEEERNRE